MLVSGIALLVVVGLVGYGMFFGAVGVVLGYLVHARHVRHWFRHGPVIADRDLHEELDMAKKGMVRFLAQYDRLESENAALRRELMMRPRERA